MKRMTEKEYNRRMRILKTQNIQRERYEKYRVERDKFKTQRKLPSTSKLILIAVILICLQIIIFCEWAMIKTGDTSAMYALIGIPAVLAPTIWGYFSKSKAENSEGGIVYEMAMAELAAAEVNNESDEKAMG